MVEGGTMTASPAAPASSAAAPFARVAVGQFGHDADFHVTCDRFVEVAQAAVAAGAGLVVMPEYWFGTFQGAPADAMILAEHVAATYEEVSRQLDIMIAGNIVEPGQDGVPRNVGVVYQHGARMLAQDKMHPMPREAKSGIVGGLSLRATDVAGRRLGMLVCADILYPEAARVLELQGADLLLNPVMSPYSEHDLTGSARDSLYIARAYDSRAFVIKAAGYLRPGLIQRPDGGEFAIAGRSLIAAPWGLLARYQDHFGHQVLVADLDWERLAAFRAHQSGFPPRRPDAYGELTSG